MAISLFEGLKNTQRTSWANRLISNPESVASHSWGVAAWAWYIATTQNPPIDKGRLLELCLLHDVHEALLGDMVLMQKRLLGDECMKHAEAGATHRVAAVLGDTYRSLVEEMGAGTTPEARLLKDCDVLDLLCRAATYWRAGNLLVYPLIEDLLQYQPQTTWAIPAFMLARAGL